MPIKVDVRIKKILRAFRKRLKQQFKQVNGVKWYWVIERTLGRRLQEFFTGEPFNFTITEFT